MQILNPGAGNEVQLWFLPQRGSSREAVLELLAGYLGRRAETLALERGEFGKPRLPPPYALEFNVSHSKDALLVGISGAQALGVDIEALRRERPVLALAERYFAASEAEALRELDPTRRQAAFAALWSCKEAFVKALGRGIGFGLARMAFAIDAAGQPTRLNVIDTSASAAAEWQIAQLRPTPEHIGAVAWRGPPRPLRAFAARA
jgi:4'-phosphopantetheinyl transferase